MRLGELLIQKHLITGEDLDRALEYEQTPPDDAWAAIEVFEKK